MTAAPGACACLVVAADELDGQRPERSGCARPPSPTDSVGHRLGDSASTSLAWPRRASRGSVDRAADRHGRPGPARPSGPSGWRSSTGPRPGTPSTGEPPLGVSARRPVGPAPRAGQPPSGPRPGRVVTGLGWRSTRGGGRRLVRAAVECASEHPRRRTAGPPRRPPSHRPRRPARSDPSWPSPSCPSPSCPSPPCSDTGDRSPPRAPRPSHRWRRNLRWGPTSRASPRVGRVVARGHRRRGVGAGAGRGSREGCRRPE